MSVDGLNSTAFGAAEEEAFAESVQTEFTNSMDDDAVAETVEVINVVATDSTDEDGSRRLAKVPGRSGSQTYFITSKFAIKIL